MAKKKRPDLDAFETELITILGEEQERFERGELKLDSTVGSRTSYRMAKKRGKTRPSPVPGKANVDRHFSQRFKRAVDSLLDKGLIQRRSIGGKVYQNQVGYNRHADKRRDIFLTEEGKLISDGLRPTPSAPPPEPVLAAQGMSRADEPPPKPAPKASKTPSRGFYDYDIVIEVPDD